MHPKQGKKIDDFSKIEKRRYRPQSSLLIHLIEGIEINNVNYGSLEIQEDLKIRTKNSVMKYIL